MFVNLSNNTYFLRTIKTGVVLVMCVSLVIVLNTYDLRNSSWISDESEVYTISMHNLIVEQFYDSHKNWNLSTLGKVLYQNANYPKVSEEKKSKNYTILIWKHWEWLKKRHLYNYGKKMLDPLRKCSVKNCVFTGDNSTFETADAIVVNLHRGAGPTSVNRNPTQKWIFLDDESPVHAFSQASRRVRLSELDGVFNWSMTYRYMSDIPVAYGRTVPRKEPVFLTENAPVEDLIPNWKQKRQDVPVAILISNCRIKFRLEIIEVLKQNVAVHAYGRCGDSELQKSCPGHFQADCKAISSYYFYLALENSKCIEYMTEKLFYNAYSKGAIPIIQGATLEDCKKLLPPNSFLHVDQFKSLVHLAQYIIEVSNDRKKLLSYHRWRNQFEVLNEHGFFGTMSVHFCRLCEAMNYNDDTTSVYTEEMLAKYFQVSKLCRT